MRLLRAPYLHVRQKMWNVIDNGKTIGRKGSEDGAIVLDEEHSLGVRVTLEQGGSTAPWSVTCGICGAFLHTAFASSEAEGKKKYEEMKHALVQIMYEEDGNKRYQMMSALADKY